MSTRLQLKTLLVSCCATIAITAATQSARAADMPAAAPPVVVPVIPGAFNVFDGWEFHAQGEVGIYGNANNPANGLDGAGINFGQLYTDRANTPILNQILLTVTKPIDPKATGYAWGFVGQAIYGSDMRFNHFLGIGTFSMANDRNQLGLIQSYVALHLPWFTSGGVDAKVGLFSSPQGFETLDPSTNPLYSHSYVYNYGVTFNHTGILTTTHVNDTLDIWLGIDTGNQTTFGSTVPGNPGNFGDPNGEPAGFVGFGLNNLFNNKLTVLALSHIGPENPPGLFPGAPVGTGDPFGYQRDMRYYNDVVLTYKINDDWTSVTELNYSRDEFGNGTGPAEFYDATENLAYSISKIFTLNGRAEIARDTKNFFVSTPTVNDGIALGEEGLPGAFSIAGAPGFGTTFGELTLGLTIKPDVPKPLALVLLRPEIRYDRILDGASLFGNGGGVSRDQFTFGGDLVVGF